MANPPAVAAFVRSWEGLAGRAHIVADWTQAAESAATLLQERGVKHVVTARLNAGLERALAPRLWGLGVETLDWHHSEGALSYLAKATAGLSMPAFAVAETGTLVEVVRDDAERLVSTLPRIHLAFLGGDQIVMGFEDAMKRVQEIAREPGPLAVTLISGPSRTGDIELRHVLGVHGPHETHALIVTGQ